MFYADFHVFTLIESKAFEADEGLKKSDNLYPKCQVSTYDLPLCVVECSSLDLVGGGDFPWKQDEWFT